MPLPLLGKDGEKNHHKSKKNLKNHLAVVLYCVQYCVHIKRIKATWCHYIKKSKRWYCSSVSFTQSFVFQLFLELNNSVFLNNFSALLKWKRKKLKIKIYFIFWIDNYKKEQEWFITINESWKCGVQLCIWYVFVL